MKWNGLIAFKEEIEEEPGIFVPKLIKHPYMGDIIGLSWKEQQGEKINADLHISNKLSVIADQQLQQNFHKIAYVTFGGAKWTISNVEFAFPRLVLTFGSLYLGEEEDVEDES